MTYPEALEYLASLAPRGWRLGLDRMQEFIRRAGLNDAIGGSDGPNFIHVAGTNGKGSVTAYLQSLLVESGYRTGAFYSPFVYDPRERVQFGREMISKADFAELTAALMPIGESLSETEFGGVTEFEFKAAVGFLYWKLKRCEWVALEVGLGGRLDATNVVTPRVSVIVSIGLDHTSILGDTVEAIAHEKAGIIKPGVPVIVGDMPDSAREVIERVAATNGAPVWRWGREVCLEASASGYYAVQTPTRRVEGLRPGIEGAAQPHNMALAVAALDAVNLSQEPESVRRGVERAALPGRFEIRQRASRVIVLDGAHNSEAGAVLAKSLTQHFGEGLRVVLVTSMVAGHDPDAFYSGFSRLVISAHMAPITFHRALDVGVLASVLGKLVPTVWMHRTLRSAINAAIEEADTGGVVLITGSFYLVGEAGKLLGSNTDRGSPKQRP